MEYFEFIQSYQRRTNVLARCRLPEFRERYKIDIGIYDLESKRILFRTVKQKGICVHIQKNIIVLFGKKNRRDSLLDGMQEIERNFKYVKNIINENILKQRIRYRFLKHETIDHLENVFVFDLETHNDHEFVEAYAAGFL